MWLALHSETPVEDLSLPDEVLVGPNGFFERNRWVHAMALVEVEVVRSKSSQGALAAFHDVFPGKAPVIGSFGHGKEALRGEHVGVPGNVAECLAEYRFGGAGRVDVRRVEEVDPHVVGRSGQGFGRRCIDGGAKGEPGSESHFADLEAAATKGASFHGSDSTPTPAVGDGGPAARYNPHPC